eukprot:GHRR01036329.1.p1 GENE.GHRR01036329.1~~GHRR01036329.1.p1  ORF type:complete len:107 (-),score=27.58 GHRR01036329.1:80-400(-)
MTDVAVFGVSFESNDLFVPAAPPIDPATATSKKAWKGKATKAAEDAEADGATASGKSGHVVKSLLPAGTCSYGLHKRGTQCKYASSIHLCTCMKCLDSMAGTACGH